MSVDSPNDQIRSHAGLRGVAALLVVAYHLQFSQFRLPIEDASLFLKRSYLFVDLFFVLSGFIISLTSERAFRTGLDTRRYGVFLAKRIARLYPLLAFSLLYMVVGRWLIDEVYRHFGRGGPLPWDDLLLLLAQATLTNAWMAHPAGWNLPSWSISAEMFAYLLFPALMTATRLFPIIGRSLLLVVPLSYYAWVAGTTQSLDVIGGTAPFRCLAGFATGMLVYQFRDRFAVSTVTLAIIQGGATCVAVAMLAIQVNDVALIPFFALLVGSTWQDRGPLSMLLSKAAPVWLGTISYSVYLNHFGVIELIGVPWGSLERMLSLDPTSGRMIWIGICSGAVLLLSTATYRWIEVPGRRWLGRRLFYAKPSPIASSPPAP